MGMERPRGEVCGQAEWGAGLERHEDGFAGSGTGSKQCAAVRNTVDESADPEQMLTKPGMLGMN